MTMKVKIINIFNKMVLFSKFFVIFANKLHFDTTNSKYL